MIDKESLNLRCDSLFDSELGKKVYQSMSRAIDENNMLSIIKNGVGIGFSGGADSVLLLIFFRKLQQESIFSLKALHVNHLIRETTADRDEAFSMEFAKALEIDYECHRANVPEFAEKNKLGTEEAARKIRYDFFDSIVKKDDRIDAIATAHNSTDNLETLIFNLMRGAGSRGLSGIAPVRDNIIRPLIYVSKEDVVKLLSDSEIPFVTDETNFSVEYTRNYIRHEILPKLKRLASRPEEMSNKAIANLRMDSEYLDDLATERYEQISVDGKIKALLLKELHSAILVRILRIMCHKYGAPMLERVHFEKIRELLNVGGDFEVDIPGGAAFVSKDSLCFITNKGEVNNTPYFEYVLNDGINEIPELNLAIALSNSKTEDFSSNVYKKSIQVNLNSAIIVGKLSVRTKKDGDSYFYGGMTRKLKKLFCDRKIPISVREKTPVITDEKGIVWVPGFGVRDDFPENKTEKWITVYKKDD